MPVVTSHPHGAPCWFELATSDQNGAKTFYTQLFGWDTVDNPMGPGQTYTIFQKGGHAVGSTFTLQPEMKAAGVPPHWAVYFACKNADETLAKATELGGSAIMPVGDVGEYGRMSVLKDPTGATFSIWQPVKYIGAEIIGENNTVCWSELATRDADKAVEFYTGLFGWSVKRGDAGGTPYHEFTPAGDRQPQGGVMQMGKEWGEMPPFWGIYFMVDDVDATVAKVKELGGKTVHGPFDVPNVGRIVILNDPQGAAFSIIKLQMPH